MKNPKLLTYIIVLCLSSNIWGANIPLHFNVCQCMSYVQIDSPVGGPAVTQRIVNVTRSFSCFSFFLHFPLPCPLFSFLITTLLFCQSVCLCPYKIKFPCQFWHWWPECLSAFMAKMSEWKWGGKVLQYSLSQQGHLSLRRLIGDGMCLQADNGLIAGWPGHASYFRSRLLTQKIQGSGTVHGAQCTK